jgi:hypothetical protein
MMVKYFGTPTAADMYVSHHARSHACRTSAIPFEIPMFFNACRGLLMQNR